MTITSKVSVFENTDFSNRTYNSLLIALSVVAFLIVLLTAPGSEIGLTVDSYNYIAASKSILNGEGYLRFTSDIPYVHWGPLYPIFLAGLNLIERVIPIDFPLLVHIANAIIYSLIVFTSGYLFRRYLRSHILGIVAVVAVVFSIPIYYVSNYVWSELLFIFLTILLALQWPKILASEATPLDHTLMALLIILTTLQRFAGYSLVPIIMLSVLLFRPCDTWIKRTRLAVQYALTGIPMFLWLMYGQIVYYNRQARGEVVDKILDNLIRMPGLLTEWFLPPELQNRLIYILFSLILGIVLFGIIVNYYRLYRNLSVYPDLRSYPVLIAFYVVTFLLGLLVAFISARAPIDIRHMSPVHVFVVLLVFYVIDLFLQRTTRQAIKTTVLVFMMIWTIYPIVSVFNRMQLLNRECCIANTIRDVDVIQWLRRNAIGPGDYYSNTPLPSVYTPLTVYAAPAKLDQWSTLLDVDKNVYLIWFNDPRPDLVYHGMSRYFYPLDFDIDALNDLAEVTLVADLDDGQIYRLQPDTLSKIGG